MAQGGVDITRVEVTPAALGWQDVDVSSYVPVGAKGVLVEIINTHATGEYLWGVRPNGGSSDVRGKLLMSAHTFAWAGLDDNRVFEAYRNHESIKVYLLAYVPNRAGEFVDNIDKSTATTGEYVDVDVSGDFSGGTAKIALLLVDNTALYDHRKIALRENGSTDDRYNDVVNNNHLGAAMGCDASEIFEQKIETAEMDLYLCGCIYSDYADSNANATGYSTDTTGEYVTTAIGIAGSGSGGAFIHFFPSIDAVYQYAVRRNDETYDSYYDASFHQLLWCAIDSSKQLQQKIESTNLDLYAFAWVKEGPVVPAAAGSFAQAAMALLT